ADVPVRFSAHGYGQDPDGKIVGRYGDMKRDVDYRILPSGGFTSGVPNTGISDTTEARTDKYGVARARFRPPKWADFMGSIATRTRAEPGPKTKFRGVWTDFQFVKP